MEISENNQDRERFGYHCLLLSQAGFIVCSGEGYERVDLRNYYPVLLTYQGQLYIHGVIAGTDGLPF